MLDYLTYQADQQEAELSQKEERLERARNTLSKANEIRIICLMIVLVSLPGLWSKLDC